MASGRSRLVSCSDLGSPIDASGAESTQIGAQGPPVLPPLVEATDASTSSAQPAARKSATRRLAGTVARAITPRSRTSSSERRGSAQEDALLAQTSPDADATVAQRAAIDAAQQQAIEAARHEALLAVQAEADSLKAKLQAEAEAREAAREAERETERLRLKRAAAEAARAADAAAEVV